MTEITLNNRQKSEKLDTAWLRHFSKVAIAGVLKHRPRKGAILTGLKNVDVVIVSNRVIAEVHRRFMNIDGPTDVITFNHGEILIGAGTARANAVKYHKPLKQEIGLYIIHGLLHLNGYTDKIPLEIRRMQKLQERILDLCLRKMNQPNSPNS